MQPARWPPCGQGPRHPVQPARKKPPEKPVTQSLLRSCLFDFSIVRHPPSWNRSPRELGEPLPLDRGPGPTQTDPPVPPLASDGRPRRDLPAGWAAGPSAAVPRWRGHWRCRRGGCARRQCRPGGARHPALGPQKRVLDARPPRNQPSAQLPAPPLLLRCPPLPPATLLTGSSLPPLWRPEGDGTRLGCDVQGGRGAELGPHTG